MRQISTQQLADWITACAHVEPEGTNDPDESRRQGRGKPLLLDVREPWEYEHCHLAESILMPMHTVPLRLNELDANTEVVVICHHGGRSMQVAAFLERNGFDSIYNLAGGVNAWAHDVDPGMRKY